MRFDLDWEVVFIEICNIFEHGPGIGEHEQPVRLVSSPGLWMCGQASLAGPALHKNYQHIFLFWASRNLNFWTSRKKYMLVIFLQTTSKTHQKHWKLMVFLVFCNKTLKNHWFFDVLLQNTKKIIGFSRFLVSFGTGLQKKYQHIFFVRGPEIQIPWCSK